MTKYEKVCNYKKTEFYNITPTHFFGMYGTKGHVLCFKINEELYLNMETHEIVKVEVEDCNMLVYKVDAKVEWSFI